MVRGGEVAVNDIEVLKCMLVKVYLYGSSPATYLLLHSCFEPGFAVIVR